MIIDIILDRREVQSIMFPQRTLKQSMTTQRFST